MPEPEDAGTFEAGALAALEHIDVLRPDLEPRDRTVWLGMHTGYPPMIAFSTEEAAHEWLREKGEGYQTTTVPLDPPEVDDA
jgi:hypothetical protein